MGRLVIVYLMLGRRRRALIHQKWASEHSPHCPKDQNQRLAAQLVRGIEPRDTHSNNNNAECHVQTAKWNPQHSMGGVLDVSAPPTVQGGRVSRLQVMFSNDELL